MLVETDGHTVPHFKAPVYAKMELWGPECGGTFSIQTSLLNISHLLHAGAALPGGRVGLGLPKLLESARKNLSFREF